MPSEIKLFIPMLGPLVLLLSVRPWEFFLYSAVYLLGVIAGRDWQKERSAKEGEKA